MGSIVKISMKTKPLDPSRVIKRGKYRASNIDINDNSILFVFSIKYELSSYIFDKLELKDLSYPKILKKEGPEEMKVNLISLVQSSMICDSLYGKLEEKSSGEVWKYYASFITNGSFGLMDDGLHNSHRILKDG